MNIIYISGVELGLYALKGIIDSKILNNKDVRIAGIFTLPKMKSHTTSGFASFSEIANELNTRLFEVFSIKERTVIEQIRLLTPDYIFIIGWSELATTQLLDIPKEKKNLPNRHGFRYGCIGMHPTLLPLGRGRAPIPWAIIKGYTESGVTMFYLEEEADSGDIIDQKKFNIDVSDDAQSIYNKVCHIHYELALSNLPLLIDGKAQRITQNEQLASYWERRKPSDGQINWHKSSKEIYDWIRGLTHPYPGAFTFYKNKKILIWKSELTDVNITKDHPGTIIKISNKGIHVACIDKEIVLSKFQFENNGILNVEETSTLTMFELGTSFLNQRPGTLNEL